MKKLFNKLGASGVFLVLLIPFFIIYSEIKSKERQAPQQIIVSDVLYYHEYIAVHLFGMEPYVPREKKPVIKYTMGMAATYMPAIFIGYLGTEFKGMDHDYGRNYVYQRVLYYLGFFYAFIGLFFLRLILKKWFDDFLIAIILAIIFFGTNLYYYVKVEPLMAHAPSFAFITAFVFYSFKLFEKANLNIAFAMGAFLAMLTLIRPTNILIALFPLIYLIADKTSWPNKLAFIKANLRIWIIIAFCLIVVFIPQMLYWHHYTGQWFYYSYRQEKFYWNNPAVLQVLFSFRKGWFIYTPIMLLIIPGFILCYKKSKPLFWSILIVFILNLYVISSWWCWWYGGSFGMRTMIDTYGLMAILIGFVLQYMWKRSKVFFATLICILGFGVYLNLFQTRQARICWIHFDSMSYAAYKRVFLTEKIEFTGEEWREMLDPPDYDKAFKGERFW